MATKAKTIADLRGAHDKKVVNPRKVEAALAAMLREGGKENHEYEADFLKRAGITQHDAADVRRAFLKHVVIATGLNSKKASRNVWFADPKTATKVCKDYPNAFRAFTIEDFNT
jgi:glycine/D-amino acid oxidase-like deaminating enzyme